MTWSPNTSIVINGIERKTLTLADVQVSYGRTSIWEQSRAGFARIALLNNSNLDLLLDMNQTISIQVNNATGIPVTIFTGKITSVDNLMAGAGTIGKSVVQTITAIGPFAQMSRKTIGNVSYPKEFDTARMTRILTEAGVTIDTVDSPPIYEFKVRDANPADAYALAASFATQANGYIYETPTGTVGFANESRRFVDQRDNGYTVIPNNYILWGSVSSQKTLADIINRITISYRAGSEVTEDTTSQAAYGLMAGSISTELHNAADAIVQGERYITLRANPRTSLSSFTIPLNSPNITASDLNTFIGMAMGEPIQITALPIGIKNSSYRGFVEGYSFSINQYEMVMNLITTDASYSITPTRWQDVPATLEWNMVGPAVQWVSYDD